MEVNWKIEMDTNMRSKFNFKPNPSFIFYFTASYIINKCKLRERGKYLMKREKILQELVEPLLLECYNKGQSGRFSSKETVKLRIAYINAFSRLLSVYEKVHENLELEDLTARLEELEQANKERGY